MGSEIRTIEVRVTTTGGAGVATGSGISEAFKGFIWDVWLDYHASAPVTTDVTIKSTQRGDTILAVSNNKTDGRYAPRMAEHDSVGASLGAGAYPLVNGSVTIDVAQCDALTDAVVAHIQIIEG